MSKRRNKIFLAFCLISIALICTMRVRCICKGIVQFRFRPTKTCVCVFICDGQMHTEDGIKPVTIHDNGKMTYGYHWPSFNSWKGELDDPMIFVPVIEVKPEPPAAPKASIPTNEPPMQTASVASSNTLGIFNSNLFSMRGPEGNVIVFDCNSTLEFTNMTISNLIVKSEYPKVLRHDPSGDAVTWGWNGLIAPKRREKFHYPDPGMVIETDERPQPTANDWR